MVGAPGSGKTAVLRAIEALATREGIPVRRGLAGTASRGTPGGDEPQEEGGLVVLDDAHLLTSELLGECIQEADQRNARLVATARPDCVECGDESVRVFTQRCRTMILEPWSTLEVAGVILSHAGATAPAEQVVAATAGLPWLVIDQLDALQHQAAARQGSGGMREGTGADPNSRLDRHVLRLLRALQSLEADVLLALAVGYPVHGEPGLPPLRDLTPESRREVVDRLWHSGLVAIDGTMPPLVRQSLVSHAQPHRVRPILTALVDDLTIAGADLRPVAEMLVSLGARDAAARSHVAGMLAGSDLVHLRVSHAEALALTGDPAAASSALAGASWETISSRGLAAAVTIAVLNGQPDRAARVANWGGGREMIDGCENAAGSAALALFAVGQTDAATAIITKARTAQPELVASPLPDMAEAVRLSVGKSADGALPALIRLAASCPADHQRALLPALPMTLAALVALHLGDLAIAEAVLADDRSLIDPAPVHASHVSALRGWASMLAGHYREAQAHLDAIDPRVVRDQPWAWGLRLGLLRRQDDVRGLAALWPHARSVLVGHAVDLYSLLPLGEIGLTAARMHEPQLAAPVWSEAVGLLSALGDPPMWSSPFHWYAVQAGILTDRPDALAPHARALVAAARTSSVAATYAAAGKAWVAVLGRNVDPAVVIASARALAGVGQAWEGSRLAGHGAARTTNKKDASHLLECARDLLGPSFADQQGSHAAPPTSAEVKAGAVDLSEREREVAQLVVAGLTYQQIGEVLFLSSRTVEHHVGRIRRRSGAQSRAELLSRLSITLGARPPQSTSASDIGRAIAGPELG